MKCTFAVTFVCFAWLSLVVSSSSSNYCGSYSLNAGVDAKILTSPNYPAHYNTSTNCSWLIEFRYSYLQVQLKFISFDTYGPNGTCTNETDNLEVYSVKNDEKTRDKLLARYCGGNLPANLTITSNNNFVYITFSSRSNETRTGFRLEYGLTQTSYCGPVSLYAEVNKPKILTSPSYPANYPPSARCAWQITAPPGQHVKLQFNSFDVGNPPTVNLRYRICSMFTHVLAVFDSDLMYPFGGYYRLLGEYCGRSLPADVASTERHLFLYFRRSLSRNYSTPQGFSLKYTAIESLPKYYSVCSRNDLLFPKLDKLSFNATGTYQYIRSPRYPDKYPSNIVCMWHITASSSSKRIKLELTNLKITNKAMIANNPEYDKYPLTCRSLESFTEKGDFLKIRDGESYYSPLLKDFCRSSNSSTTVISLGQYMTVTFSTNKDNFFVAGTAGFEARYMEINPPENTAPEKTNVGMIVGIVIGVLAVVGLVVLCVCLVKRKRSEQPTGYVQAGTELTSKP